MPFGLTNSPATFQRTMDKVFAQMKWSKLIVFLDDILIFSDTFEEHLIRLEACFQRLSEAGLTIKPSKATFCIPGVSFLGHFVDHSGIKMQPSKVEAVRKFAQPQTVRDVRSFLGLASYYRKFVRNFADIARPISNLTKKETPFEWSEKCESAFKELKDCLLSFPTLCHYDPETPVELHCDSSGYGLGAVIGHRREDRFQPIQFASRLLSTSEINYSTTDKESLAVIWSVQKFHMYLMSKPFRIFTDHKALSWLHTKEKLPPRLMRFALEMQHYEYEIAYKPGAQNTDADALSRYPVSPPEETEENMTIAVLSLQREKDKQTSKDSSCQTSLSDKLRVEQSNDDFCISIMNSLRRAAPDQENQTKFTIIDSLLYRKTIRNGSSVLQLCIPKSMMEDVMVSLHDDLFGCHQGVAKTLGKIRERFYFPKMENYVRKYIRSCTSCQLRKTERLAPYGYLKSITPEEPFSMIGIDVFGPVTRSRAGNKYVIAACDYLTRYVEMKAVPAATSKQVAKFLLENIIRNHGFVSKILSDRGTCFLSAVMQDFYDQCSIQKINTTHYRPQCDGLVEAYNKTLGIAISHYVSEDQRDWDKHLPILQLAYNSSVSTATKYTPFFLVHHRNPRTILETELQLPPSKHAAVEINSAWSNAKKAIRDSQERSQKYYNARRRAPDFAVGDVVLKYNPTPSKHLTQKLLPKFHSSLFEIIEDCGNNVFKIREIEGKRRKSLYANVQMLKHYHERKLYSSDSDEPACLSKQKQREKSSSSDSEYEIFFPTSLKPDSHPETQVPPNSPLPASESSAASEDEGSYHSALSMQAQASSLPFISTGIAKQAPPKKPPRVRKETSKPRLSTPYNLRSRANNDGIEMNQIPDAAAHSDKPVKRLTDPQTTPADNNDTATDESDASNATACSNTPLRRSKRLKAKTAGKTFPYLFLMAVITIAVPKCDPSFTKVAPIVWRYTDRPVISGVTEVSVEIEFESPCFIFNQTLTSRFGSYTDSLRQWCDNLFLTSFEKRMEPFCNYPGKKPASTITLGRHKRGLVTAVVLGTLAVSAFTTIGVSGYSAYNDNARNAKIDEMARQQDVLLQQNQQLHNLINHTAFIINELEKSQSVLGDRITGLERDFQESLSANLNSMTTISSLSSRLMITEERLRDTAKDWKQGLLNPKFLQTFNITLPCTDDCPSNLLKPQDCFFDPLRHRIHFNFIQRTVKRQAQILKADPFSLIRNVTQYDTCFVSYRGPPSVIYDARIDCVTPLKGNVDTSENVILSPSIAYCSDSSPLNTSEHYWTHEECIKNEYLRPEDIVQIKAAHDHNFIFCQTLKITVFNRTYDCPTHVFSLPHYASFMIGKMTYTADQLQLTSSLKVAPVHTSRVNFHLLPLIPNFNEPLESAREMSSELATELEARINTQTRHSVPISHVNLVLSLLMLLLMVFIIRALGIKIPQIKLRQQPAAENNIDADRTEEEQAVPVAPVRQFRSSRAAKHTLLVSLVAVAAFPAVQSACPQNLTVPISIKICPDDLNYTMSSICKEMQTNSILKPYLNQCTQTSLQTTPAITSPTAFPISITVMQSRTFAFVSIIKDWNDQTINEMIMDAANIDPECTPDIYRPLNCLIDIPQQSVAFELDMRHTITTPLIFMMPELARLLSPLSSVLLIIVVAISAVILQRKCRLRHKRWEALPDVIPLPDAPPSYCEICGRQQHSPPLETSV